jgi:hypothetical protein
LYAFLILPIRLSHFPWLLHHINIWWSAQVMKFLIMQSSPVSHHFLPLRSKYSPQHLFSDTLSLCFCIL